MLIKVEVKNFRGIKSLTVDGINQLNLFLGYNNCGKSSLLEALYLLCDPSHPVNDIQINRARHYLLTDKEPLSLDFYGRDTSLPITVDGTFDSKEERQLVIKYFERQRDKTDLDNLSLTNKKSDVIYGLENLVTISKDKILERYSFRVEPVGNNHAKTKVNKKDKEFTNGFDCGYMQPRGYGSNILEAFRDIVENKEESNIVETLRNIEPNLKALSLVGGQIMADVGLKKKSPYRNIG